VLRLAWLNATLEAGIDNPLDAALVSAGTAASLALDAGYAEAAAWLEKTRAAEADGVDVRGPREQRLQASDEPCGKILVDEDLHAAPVPCLVSSISAARARHARMSSRVIGGYSATISSAVIPADSQPSTSATAMRVPRTQALPNRMPGSTEMRSRQSMAEG
jgi:hypothetical protein